MKRIVVATSLSLLMVMSSFTLNKEEEKISWNKDKKLTWHDFKGKPNKVSKDAAMTNSGFGFESGSLVNDSISFIVINYFYPATSWVKKDEETEALLAHEQCHFDITELYTRKFRKQLKAAKFNSKTMQSVLENLFHKCQSDWKDYEDKYDMETEHSKIVAKQLEWEKKVANELSEMNSYTETTVKVYLK